MGRVTTVVWFGPAATHDIFLVSLRPVSRERPKRTGPGYRPAAGRGGSAIYAFSRGRKIGIPVHFQFV